MFKYRPIYILKTVQLIIMFVQTNIYFEDCTTNYYV